MTITGISGTPLDPRSPQAQAIADLFVDTLILCGIIFAIVTMLVGYAVFRFRAKKDEKTPPPQIEGNTRLEIGWTVAPLVVLVVIFGLTMRAASSSDPPPDREPDLTVIAHQWWWEVKYKSGVVTANEIHIPTNKALVVGIETADVIHDFWVPDLARKIDAVPGRSSAIWMQASAPGAYTGACAEYCGAQHAWMRILVIAESPEEYAAWEQKMLARPATPTEEAAVRGEKSFQAMTCVRCHAVGQAGGAANAAEPGPRAGPDLSHLAARQTLGAGVAKNTPDELARWLKHPQEIKPGSHMPDLQLTDAQVKDLVAYFGSLK